MKKVFCVIIFTVLIFGCVNKEKVTTKEVMKEVIMSTYERGYRQGALNVLLNKSLNDSVWKKDSTMMNECCVKHGFK